jgi:hypothetical protein
MDQMSRRKDDIGKQGECTCVVCPVCRGAQCKSVDREQELIDEVAKLKAQLVDTEMKAKPHPVTLMCAVVGLLLVMEDE